MKKVFRLGTRGSPLALVQAQYIKNLILKAYAGDESETATALDVEIIPIRTTGDWKPEHKEQTFFDLGGNKALFTKEIDEALMGGFIDAAVHSMKDVSTTLPDGIRFAAMPPRDDVRDAFICKQWPSLEALPQGARVGTASLRRRSQLLAARPDLTVMPFRGNVDTRLRKLTEGVVDATILAVAGLHRLAMDMHITAMLDVATMLPAAAQGALGVAVRAEDAEARALLAPLHDVNTGLCVAAERALLRVLDGSCQTPIAALALISPSGDRIRVNALLADPDGRTVLRRKVEGPSEQAAHLGEELGRLLRVDAPAGVLEKT